MKFEVGDGFQTKDKKLVRILAVDAPSTAYPIIGYRMDSGEPITWTAEGKFRTGISHSSSLDLVPRPQEISQKIYLIVPVSDYAKANAKPMLYTGDLNLLNTRDWKVVGATDVTITEEKGL